MKNQPNIKIVPMTINEDFVCLDGYVVREIINQVVGDSVQFFVVLIEKIDPPKVATPIAKK